MGVESRKAAPPLPAPTETESTTATELATDVSRPVDDKSSYSLPEDGTPVTIKTRGHKANRSQTSLLIEYFEGGKPGAPSGAGDRKPSVRVRLTPSKNRNNDRIQITETKSTRKASLTRRSNSQTPTGIRPEHESLSVLSGDGEDAKSMSSYASATEESNVSRNPIEVDIDRSGAHRRQRRPASPLIPTESSRASYQPGTMSEISAIPTDSFLDGSGPSKSYESRRSHSPSRGADLMTGAAAGLGAAVLADKVRSRNRGEEKERVVISKGKDKERSDRKSKSSRSRTSSVSEKDPSKSSRRRSSRSHEESLVSAADSSVVSSGLDQHSVRSGASKSSINNPKLLETVEDAIRRLILPELNALKREQSRRGDRRSSVTSSGTSYAEKEEEVTDRRRSGASDKPVVTSRDSITRLKERRDREARHDLDASPIHAYDDDESVTESYREVEQTPKRSTDKLKAAAAAGVAGATLGGLGVAALSDNKSPNIAREQRRRRRAEAKGRSSDRHLEEHDDSEYLHPTPPMPLMSEINPSELTRTSILSAESDRPTSASEEFTPVQEVSRGVLSTDSGSPTPTKNNGTLQSLGTQHANISHGDLRALPRKGIDEYDEEQEYGSTERLRDAPVRPEDDYDEEYEESHHREGDMGQYSDPPYLYSGQVVPAPLKYVPYQPERRGLSPIPSVSGYTEGGSEVQGNRDSRVTHTSASSPDKSPRLDRTLHSPSSIPSNIMAREFDQDDRSVRSSGADYRNTQFTEDSELDHAAPGQAVRPLGANPNIIHSPVGVESAVASLVDGSMLDESVLTAESGNGGRDLHAHRGSMETLEEEASHGHATPSKRSVGSRHALVEDDEYGRVSPATTRTSEFGDEYDLDQYGRKVPRSKYRHSPTASEMAITAGALGAAAAAIRAQKGQGKQAVPADTYDAGYAGGAIPQRNKSFKERTIDGQQPANTPTHSVDRLVDEYERPKMGVSGLPDRHNPDPEIGFGYHDTETNPSVVDGRLDGLQDREQQQHWPGDQTPTRDRLTPYEQEAHHSEKGSGHGLGITAAAGAAAIATAAALASSHSRQPSQEPEVDEDWHRTSMDRKRDTLVTNPYEGASPIANLPAPNENLLKNTLGPSGYGPDYATHSPLGHKVDEGYISQGPNKTPEVQVNKGKGVVDFTEQPDLAGVDDPFYMPKHGRHLSGMSQGMGSPLYDAATGAGIDRIDNKDIVALMQHLMVRDAQRSARDTEILVTLVRAAAEMRENFDKMNKMMVAQEKGLTNELRERIADTEDVIITEVKENTEKTVRSHIGGPRPFPGSGARSLQAGSQAETDDFPAKKQNVFRRALKGLSAKGNNDLGKIEDMLMQLLSEVDVLKAQTAGGSHQGQSLDNMDPEIAYEQDRGYEPEGHAGTSTTSHASQSGHLSINSRGPSARLGYERKFSDHRISTVPEANEDEYDAQQQPLHDQQYVNQDLLSPQHEVVRGGSAPLGTPPPSGPAAQGSLSNENTPRTDKGKKHKSGGSVGWFPKISRWSETTTSSVGKVFRSSKDSKRGNDLGEFHSGPSRSGSDLAAYADYHQTDPYGEDKLHSGFSQPDLLHQQQPMGGEHGNRTPMRQTPPLLSTYMTPEDPKYHVHRNSLNLQHPQPRSGQPFKAALESRAEDYDNAMSPKSAEWAGSATSLHRFPPQNPHRYSDNSAAFSAAHDAGQQFWTSSPANAPQQHAGPPRPPKEPIEEHARTPPQARRVNKLQKNSPLPYHSVESGYGTATQGAPSVRSNGSPRPINQNLTSALSMPTRRPSGPRAMTPKSEKSDITEDDMRPATRRKRDTFGTIASQESETF